MNIRNVIDQKWFPPAIVGVVGVASGFGVGFLYGKRLGWNNAVDMVEDAVDELNDGVVTLGEAARFVAQEKDNLLLNAQKADAEEILEDEEYGDPSKTVALIEENESNIESSETMRLFNREESKSPVIIDNEVIEKIEVVEEELVQVNIFTSPPEDWDEDKEEEGREPGKPYVISKPEFDHNEGEWPQETLTYYAGDKILCGINDEPIDGYERLTGPLKFGHGSGDPVVVYIRNEVHHIEWEICMHMGRYEVEVLGLDVEDKYEENDLRHSADRRFRQD